MLWVCREKTANVIGNTKQERSVLPGMAPVEKDTSKSLKSPAYPQKGVDRAVQP